MISHEQTRELINEIKTLIALAENHSLGYSALEHARKLVFRIELENENTTTLEPANDSFRGLPMTQSDSPIS